MATKAVILLSGGMDSATTLAFAAREGYELYALSFHYGQKNLFELRCAEAIARQFGVKRHLVIRVDLREIGGSALTSSIPVPKRRLRSKIPKGIPVTYVPARNTIFLSFALAWAETLPSSDIFIGVNHLDASGYPDCRPEYISSFETLAHYATRIGTEESRKINIHAPLINMKKSEIIQEGMRLGVDFAKTSSCYEPSQDGRACGACDSCILRIQGFNEAGLSDPAPYGAHHPHSEGREEKV